jgi:hypothetical protein
MNLADRYRDQAKWASANAEKAGSQELRQQWLDLARQYEVLATEHSKPKPA